MRSNSEASAAVAFHEMAMPGPSRISGFGGSTPPAPNLQPSPSIGSPLAQTTIAVGTYTQRSTIDSEQHQTFAAKKDIFMNREKDVMNSIADLNRFLKEAVSCSDRLVARDERIHELMTVNAALKRKLKE
ncbi:hypothetical protein ACTXT7_012041 [Hymenolepis weldensis]